MNSYDNNFYLKTEKEKEYIIKRYLESINGRILIIYINGKYYNDITSIYNVNKKNDICIIQVNTKILIGTFVVQCNGNYYL